MFPDFEAGLRVRRDLGTIMVLLTSMSFKTEAIEGPPQKVHAGECYGGENVQCNLVSRHETLLTSIESLEP
jgi:hypothetical protein